MPNDIIYDISKLQQSEINEIPFDLNSARGQGGVKVSIHELPQAGRMASFNGIFEDEFTIDGEIMYSMWGALKTILDNQQEIILTLPPIFDSNSVVFKPFFQRQKYDVDVFNKSAIGKVKFTLYLSKSSLASSPPITKTANINDLLSAKDQARQSNFDRLVNAYKVTAATINDAKNTIQTLASNIQGVTNNILSVPDALSNFQDAVSELQLSIGNLINSPANLADKLSSIMEEFGSIGQTGRDQLIAIKSLLSGNINTRVGGSTSQFSDEIYQATAPVNEYVFIEGLILAAETAAIIDYESPIEIENNQKYVNDKFKENISAVEDINTHSTLQNIVTIMNIILNNQNKSVKTYKYIYTSPLEVSRQIYNTIDRWEEIVNFNNITDPTFINGTIKVLP